MAYNALSGTVIAAQNYIPGSLVVGNIVSGNLSTSDASSVINIPRVSNATNNAVITNVGGDANTLVCESNLTFDGSVLSITGELTASIGMSASFFEGDGSRLTGITAEPGPGGIFTLASTTQAYTTSSVNIGSSATPTNPLSVVGNSKFGGGIIHKRVLKTGDYAVTVSDYFIGVNTTSGEVTLTLPTANTTTSGQTWIIKDEGGAANTNNVVVSRASTDTIDGQNTIVLESPYASVQLYCNGTNKYFVY
jgi:hypothetical protein